MAIAVQSTASSSMGSGGTINKPSGLAVGELLLGVVAGSEFNATTISAPAGWTTLFRSSSGANNFGEVLVGYITATATEVSASNFTFANADGGLLLRISGSVNSLISSGVGAVTGNENLVIAIGLTADNDSDSTSFSGYSITGGASVSFTERYDSSTSSGVRVSLGVATGVYSSTDNITAFSANPDSGGLDDVASFLVKIPAQQDATASNALFQTSPVTFATLTGSTQEPMNDYMQISPDFPNQSGVATVPSVWTTVTKS